MNRHRFSDVVTCDIMFLKVSGSTVFGTPLCALRLLSIFYITFINIRNNVTTSLANVYRPFLGDVMVTLSACCHLQGGASTPVLSLAEGPCTLRGRDGSPVLSLVEGPSRPLSLFCSRGPAPVSFTEP